MLTSFFAVCVFAFFSLLVCAHPQATSVTVPTTLASPTSVTTNNSVQTTNGTMIETCVFTFTPVDQQIQEVKNCTLAMGGSQVTTTTIVSASATRTAAAAAAFVMPGTSIQVLPIGLGIYGGITAIGICFVAFVTWERVQYRKSFRQQRMIENNVLGYDGRVTKG